MTSSLPCEPRSVSRTIASVPLFPLSLLLSAGALAQPGYRALMVKTVISWLRSPASLRCRLIAMAMGGALMLSAPAYAHEYPDTVKVKVGTTTTFSVKDQADCKATVWIEKIEDDRLATITPVEGFGVEVEFTVEARVAGETKITVHWTGEDVGQDGPCTEDTMGGPGNDIVLRVTPDVVNSNADASDREPGDGHCDTGDEVERDGKPEPECTLRAAIEEANSMPGADLIRFDLTTPAPHVIRPDGPLPEITDPVNIAGMGKNAGDPSGKAGGKVRQQDKPQHAIDGTNAGNTSGVRLGPGSKGSKVTAVAVVNFQQSGILIGGDQVRIEGCWIGIDLGEAAAPNKGDGIQIQNAKSVLIGDTTTKPGAAPGNRIANNRIGVFITGGASESNTIAGNEIVKQEQQGIFISDAPKNLIGGDSPAKQNVISANKGGGIVITGTKATGNRVEGNLIGTDAQRTGAMGNTEYGVRINGAPKNVIGGAAAKLGLPPGNLIANNTVGALIVGKAAEENRILGNEIVKHDSVGVHISNAPMNTVGGADVRDRNLVSENREGIRIAGSTAIRNSVLGNFIGTDAEGKKTLGNGWGVVIDAAPRNHIGENTNEPGIPPGNVISGNVIAIVIKESAAAGNEVKGNIIGLAADGESTVSTTASQKFGIDVRGAPKNLIGGPAAGDRNVMTGSMIGVRIEGASALMNRIQGNFIGVTKKGRPLEISNRAGVWIGRNAPNNLIGGIVFRPGTGRGNVISGNSVEGVVLMGDGSKVEGNLIGPAPDGSILVSSDRTIRNVQSIGVWILGSRNTIGGGARRTNIIAHNFLQGIRLLGGTGNVIAGNVIGSRPGSRRPMNPGTGIRMARSTWNRIGGRGIDEANFIVGNSIGVELETTSKNEIVGNKIVDNVGSGIVLAGGARGDRITRNRIEMNGTGIEVLTASPVVLGNTIKNNTSPNSGIHLDASQAVIRGNSITGDAGDGITLRNRSEAVVEGNNISENAGFAVHNEDAFFTVDARGNWWGDPGGPSGAGTGGGNGVSDGVDFSAWREAPVALVASFDLDSLFIPPGQRDTTLALLQNWHAPGEDVEVTVTSPSGWLESAGSTVVTLDDTLGAGMSVALAVPDGTAHGEANLITLTATSTSNPDDIVSDSLVVVAYKSALSRIAVSPDSMSLQPGDSVQFVAQGFDEQDRAVATSVEWQATGGTIDESGTFTAGNTVGVFAVTARSGATEGTAVVLVGTSIGIDDEDAVQPAQFRLYQNYPNPFNPQTVISIDVARQAHVHLAVFDLLGRVVAVLVDEPLAPGRYREEFDAADLASGVYLYRVSIGGFVQGRKMVLLR